MNMFYQIIIYYRDINKNSKKIVKLLDMWYKFHIKIYHFIQQIVKDQQTWQDCRDCSDTAAQTIANVIKSGHLIYLIQIYV